MIMHYQALMAQPNEPGNAFKFGVKVGYQPTLWNGRGGLAVANHWPIGVFAGYHFENVDMGPPPLGFGVQFMSIGLETGLFYHSMDVSGSRKDIDPETKVLFCHSHETIPFNVKSLRVPISVRCYMGKSRKCCFFASFNSIFILSVSKVDWLGEFAERFGHRGLKKYLQDGGTDPYEERMYHGQGHETYVNPEYRKNRDAFYAEWQKRKEKDKHTSIPISNVSSNRLQFGCNFGLSYELDMGLIFSWTMLSVEALTLGTTFTLGYDLNRLLKLGNKTDSDLINRLKTTI